MRRRFHFSTVVWGPWHLGVFLDANLPSLLAEGNLRAFAGMHDVTYNIITSEEDFEYVNTHPMVERARAILPVNVLTRKIDRTQDPIALHHLYWAQSIEMARNDHAMILFVPPDVIWSGKGYKHIAELAAKGHKAIFGTYIRVVSETAVPAVKARYQNAETGVIDVPERELVDMAMRHMHPLALAYERHAKNFPVHPELIFWPVGKEGYLMRHLVREMFAYDPGEFDLNQQALLAHAPDPDSVHYITDSDDLFALSLTTMMKDIEWYSERRRYNPRAIGEWWLRYDSPSNNLVSSQCFYFHTGGRDSPEWKRAERESEASIRLLRGTRDVLRYLSEFHSHGLHHGEQALSYAMIRTKIAYLVKKEGRITILMPTPDAINRALFEEERHLIEKGNGRAYMNRIFDHVVFGDADFVPGRDMVLLGPFGRKRQVSWHGSTAFVDGVPVLSRAALISDDVVYNVGGLLPAL